MSPSNSASLSSDGSFRVFVGGVVAGKFRTLETREHGKRLRQPTIDEAGDIFREGFVR